MKTIRWFALAAVAAIAVVFPAPAAAQSKVGVVNLQKALQDTAEIKAAEADLKAKYGPRQEELANLEKEINKLQAEGEANAQKYTEAALAEISSRLQLRQRQYQRNSQALQDDVNRERQDILQRVGQRLQEVIKKVAEEKGLDLVIDQANLLFNKAAMEISADVTAAYDKAYPAKK
jgi:outer membrane protein